MPGQTAPKTLQHGACTINIYRPTLTPAERAKREQNVKEILGREMLDYLRRKDTKR